MVGDNIRKFRKAQGLSQNDLARRTNLTKRAIAYYEKEADNEIFTKLALIANALNVSLADLFSTDDSKQGTGIDSFDTRTIKKILKIKKLPAQAQNQVREYADFIFEKNRDKLK